MPRRMRRAGIDAKTGIVRQTHTAGSAPRRGIGGSMKGAQGDCIMNAKDAFGLVVRTLGLLCMLLALNEVRMMLLLAMAPEGEIIGAYAQLEASAAFEMLVGLALMLACEPIVRLVYGKSPR